MRRLDETDHWDQIFWAGLEFELDAGRSVVDAYDVSAMNVRDTMREDGLTVYEREGWEPPGIKFVRSAVRRLRRKR